jgi:Raf kinase inhibitor-like YbhB/YbcL family protein
MSTNLEHAALAAPQTISVTSPAFAPGKPIPRECSGYGENVSPALKLAGVPVDAQLLAIVVDDPDAPHGTFTHWTAWDIANASEIPRGADIKKLKGTQGRNDAGTNGYFGPKPPSGTHRYRFRVFALKEKLGLPHGAPVADVWTALDGKVRAWGELAGTYTKQ